MIVAVKFNGTASSSRIFVLSATNAFTIFRANLTALLEDVASDNSLFR